MCLAVRRNRRDVLDPIEWLLLIVLAAFAVIELARWMRLEGTVVFLNNHWPGLMIASMCFLMGMAGLQNKDDKPGL